MLRLHHSDYGGTEFNPGAGAATRFAPLRLATGRFVPTMYAALRREAALAETVFHDVDPSLHGAGVFSSLFEGLVLCRITCSRHLRLADLTTPGLRKLGLRDDALVHGDPTVYPLSAQWAVALHQWRRRDPAGRLDGLLWESRLSPPDLCMVLFGDRVQRSTLTSSRPISLGYGRGYTLVSRYADRLDVAVYD